MTVTRPTDRALRIGTRASALAVAQAEQVALLLSTAVPGLRTQLVPTTTEADAWPGDLASLGGKGLFVKAIDRQLQCGEVDIAVHCLKDVPGDVPLPDGLVIAAMLPRADARDALLVPEGSPVTTLAELPPGAVVATAAVRRRAQILARWPHLTVVQVRGAIDTRLRKLDGPREGQSADAMVLGRAGLERLGLADRIVRDFEVHEMLPAVGAGVLVVECRRDDRPTRDLLRAVDDPATRAEATAERSLLYGLRGHCNSPIAGYCVTTADGRLDLRGMVFSRDGSTVVHARARGAMSEDPGTLGKRVCADLLGQGARDLIDSPGQ
ncbi:hydroxymethylbilane synthase [Streptomyces bohaiensis]|uniref:hydroxymethylbilane synthase n=1 Tax=Streptomyces bohaiensis TaxID=1431344 RepID=UPI003B77ABA4